MNPEDHSFNLTDFYCYKLFPELREQFAEGELRSASDTGSYIFHEIYFVHFIVQHRADAAILRRVGGYIEYLASNENNYLVDLAEIGILESLISRGFTPIARHLGPASKRLVLSALSHHDVDPAPWQ